jgi:[ribosomal protein S18]-alanine N-acetyltransferase
VSQGADEARIVPAGSLDMETLAGLHAASFGEPWGADTFARILASPGGFAFLAREPGIWAGFALCRAVVDECELLSLGVLPAHRGRGIGRRLALRALDAARIRGAAAMFLEVADDNRPARLLYDSLGFRQVGRRRGYYARGPARIDALTLRIALPRVA